MHLVNSLLLNSFNLHITDEKLAIRQLGMSISDLMKLQNQEIGS